MNWDKLKFKLTPREQAWIAAFKIWRRRHPYYFWSIVGLVVVLVAWGAIASRPEVTPEFERVEQGIGAPFVAGDRIVQALNEVHRDYEVYPQALEQIVPAYIESVPEPGWGKNQWHYILHDDQYFSLWVENDKETGRHIYDSGIGEWTYILM